MRLLLLTPDFPPARGGVQFLLDRLASSLSGRHDVRIVAPAQAGDHDWDRTRAYRVRRVPGPRVRLLGLGLLAAGAVWEIVRARPDLIVCGHVVLGPLCAFAGRLFGIPYIAMGYGSELRSTRMRHVAGIGLRGARAVVTISDFARQAILAHGVRPERIHLLNPGAGLEVATPSPNVDVRADDTKVLLTVSRLVERYKGHDMVIRALPLIRAKIPTVRYVIVGDGWLRTYLARIAASLGVSDAVVFAGELPDDGVGTWYRRCDVFVLMSRESATGGGAEGYGLVFIEANLHGKPVLGGRSGGIPDAVIDGVTGLLVDPQKIGEIADAAVRLLSDEALARRLGAAGRRRAVDELSWSRYLVAFERVLAAVS